MYRNSLLANSVRWALLAGAATAVSAQAVAADDQKKDDQKIERIEVTGSHIKRTDMEGSLPVTVITRATIEQSGKNSVADIIRDTTFNSFGSFRPQSGSSAQSVAEVDLRGLGSGRTLVLIDGHRAPKAPSTGSSNDLNAIPLAAVERVEILSDGASAVYGSDAIGGVINIITRKDFNGAELTVGQSDLDKYKGGSGKQGSVVFGASSDKGHVLGGVSWNKRDITYAREFPWSNVGQSVYGNNFVDPDTGEIIGGAQNYGPDGAGCSDPNFVAAADGNCYFNYAAVSADEAATENRSLFLKGTYNINDDWSVFMDSSVARVTSFGRYAPVPDYVTISADSPNNPFGRTINLAHRYAALGNRDNNIENNNYDVLVGAQGNIGGVAVDFGIRRNEDRYIELGRNYLVRAIATSYINSGEYDIYHPNDNPADVLNAMKATTSRDSTFGQDEMYANATFDLFDMDAGTVQLAVGGEWRRETYVDTYDSLSEAGQIGGSSGNSAGGGRIARAAYFETLIPLTEKLELDVAGRYDSYSDYGSDFSPKVSFRWSAMDGFVLRGSYGEGFRAPTLDILTQKTAFSADTVSDPDTCTALGNAADCNVQIDAYRLANPSLQSETSKQYSLGFAWQPKDWFNMTLDYYNIQIDNRINFFSAQDLINKEQAGDPIPPGLGVYRFSSNNRINYIDTGYGNQGTLKTSGIDTNFRTNFDLGDFGYLKNQLQVSYVDKYTIDGGRNLVNDPGTPQMRMSLQNVYNIADFEIAYNINYIDSTAYDVESGGKQVGSTPSFTTHDLQVTYNTSWKGKISVGVNNMFDRDPPLNPNNVYGRAYDFGLYSGLGRMYYARYTQSF